MRSLFDRMFFDPFNRLADQSAHVVPILIMVLVTLVVGGFLAFVARWTTYRLLQLAQDVLLASQTDRGNKNQGSSADYHAKSGESEADLIAAKSIIGESGNFAEGKVGTCVRNRSSAHVD